MFYRSALQSVVAGLVVGLTACGSQTAPAQPAASGMSGPTGTPIAYAIAPAGVQAFAELIAADRFSQAQLTVKAGQPVSLLVTNRGGTPHNWHLRDVRDAGGREIATGRLAAGKSEALQFLITQAGTYQFQDDLHPEALHGTLAVQ